MVLLLDSRGPSDGVQHTFNSELPLPVVQFRETTVRA